MATPQEISARIVQVKTYIQDCERRIAKGEPVPLTGLDDNVTEICSDINALPQEDGAALEPELAGLIDVLDKLVATIREFDDSVFEDDTSKTDGV
ncbi:MAG: hypothetical protein EA357_10895 [Micavibrio sp.]|nr:MAG: hypothetical protein EA357_10895 [Micavibrio sp.]